MKHRRGFFAAVALLGSFAAATDAHAGPADEKKACLDAFVDAQKFRAEKKRDEARKALLTCSRPMCPKVAKEPCGQWLTELDAEPAPFADVADPAARKLAEEGAAAADRKDAATALDRFERADKASPAPSVTLGIARAQAALGHFAAATRAYRKLVAETGPAAEAAKAEIGAVEARAAHLSVAVAGATTIELDDHAVDAGSEGDLVVDAGPHKVRARNAAGELAETSITLTEGASQTVDLAFPEHRRGLSARRKVAIGAWAVGGAGLAVGVVGGVLAIGKHADLKTACANGCPPSEHDAHQSYRTMGTVSTVGFVVAGVGAAGGLVLWLTEPKKPATVGLSAGVGLGSVDLRGTF